MPDKVPITGFGMGGSRERRRTPSPIPYATKEYQINWFAFPTGDAYDAPYLNALMTILGDVDPRISEECYQELPSSHKMFWIPVNKKEGDSE